MSLDDDRLKYCLASKKASTKLLIKPFIYFKHIWGKRKKEKKSLRHISYRIFYFKFPELCPNIWTIFPEQVTQSEYSSFKLNKDVKKDDWFFYMLQILICRLSILLTIIMKFKKKMSICHTRPGKQYLTFHSMFKILKKMRHLEPQETFCQTDHNKTPTLH